MKSGALAILCSLVLFAGTAPAGPRETVFPDDRTLGNPKAPVVLIEYLAPTCPHCAHFATTVFPEIKRTYIDTGKVLYVLRIFPLSALDGAVAGLAKCMGPRRYYEFLDLALKNQAMWDPNGNEIKDQQSALVQLGGMAGLKPEQANRCMKDTAEFARINRIAADGADRFRIEGVPTLVMGGATVADQDMEWPALQSRINAELAASAAMDLLAPAAKRAPGKAIVSAKPGHKVAHHKLQKKKHGKPAVHKPHKKAKPVHKSVKAKRAKKH